ncbi:hypothetical protein CN175_20450, partial [Sinorhizobium meliloti]
SSLSAGIPFLPRHVEGRELHTSRTPTPDAFRWGRHHLGIRGRLFLGIGGRDHFGIRGRIASEFALLGGYNNALHSIFSGFSRALEWLTEGKIPLDGLVRSTSPDNPERLYADIMARHIDEPFIVLDWSGLTSSP